MSPSARTMMESLMESARQIVRAGGAMAPVAGLANAEGDVVFVAIAGSVVAAKPKVAELARARRATAVALIGEAWCAPVRSEADLGSAPCERADRRSAVLLEVFTPTRDYSFVADIEAGDGWREVGEFVQGRYNGPWAGLLLANPAEPS